MLLLLGSCENNSKLNLEILHANNWAFALFATLFAVNMDSVAVHLQIELIGYGMHFQITFVNPKY